MPLRAPTSLTVLAEVIAVGSQNDSKFSNEAKAVEASAGLGGPTYVIDEHEGLSYRGGKSP